MMSREQVMAYGRKIGCKFYVRNSNGGLLGGFTTREAAEKYKAEEERRLRKDRLNHKLKVYIEEVKTP